MVRSFVGSAHLERQHNVFLCLAFSWGYGSRIGGRIGSYYTWFCSIAALLLQEIIFQLGYNEPNVQQNLLQIPVQFCGGGGGYAYADIGVGCGGGKLKCIYDPYYRTIYLAGGV